MTRKEADAASRTDQLRYVAEVASRMGYFDAADWIRARLATEPEPAPDVVKLVARVVALEDALVWCSGSDDFAPGGKAREGFERIVLPLLEGIGRRG